MSHLLRLVYTDTFFPFVIQALQKKQVWEKVKKTDRINIIKVDFSSIRINKRSLLKGSFCLSRNDDKLNNDLS